MFSNSFLFPVSGGTTIEIAVSQWRDRANFKLDGVNYSLYREGEFRGDVGRHFFVLDGEHQVGAIFRKGMWSRRTYVDLPQDWPLPLQLFVFWLALVVWIREEAA